MFRTTDGGKTWERVLFVDENTGCSDLVMDPNNPRILFAGMWQLEIHTWGRESGGPGSGLFMSTRRRRRRGRGCGHGLPEPPVGKIASPSRQSNSEPRLRADRDRRRHADWNGKETRAGQLWRSDDGGGTWRMVSADRNATGAPHYYTRMARRAGQRERGVFPDRGLQQDARRRHRPSSISRAGRRAGGDNHDMWIDPTNANRMIVAHDDGRQSSRSIAARRWHRDPPADRADVSRRRSTTRSRTTSTATGRTARRRGSEQQPARRAGPRQRLADRFRAACGTPSPAARAAGRLRIRSTPTSIWSSGIRLRQRRRHRRALRRAHAAGAQRRNLAGCDDRHAGGRREVSLQLDVPAHDVAARSQHDLRGQPARAPDDERRPELAGDQPRPDDQRQDRQQISGGLTPDNIGVEYAASSSRSRSRRWRRG